MEAKQSEITQIFNATQTELNPNLGDHQISSLYIYNKLVQGMSSLE
jgi:hypothetical protein